MTGPRPGASAFDAVIRAKGAAERYGCYILGAGDFRPVKNGESVIDMPWTPGTYTDAHGNKITALGSDCCGFAISFAYKLVRHRPGFNVGSWATISDDINCNSAIEDADHHGELFERITRPELGALLVYPTVYKDGKQIAIGHVVIVVGISRCLEWDATKPDYGLLDVAECCGPNGRGPGVILRSGASFNNHDHLWPKPAHRTVMLRVKA